MSSKCNIPDCKEYGIIWLDGALILCWNHYCESQIMPDWTEIWNKRPPECKCEPPWSSRPSICPVHCHCMRNGKSLYDPMIDGRCRRCKNYPIYS